MLALHWHTQRAQGLQSQAADARALIGYETTRHTIRQGVSDAGDVMASAIGSSPGALYARYGVR